MWQHVWRTGLAIAALCTTGATNAGSASPCGRYNPPSATLPSTLEAFSKELPEHAACLELAPLLVWCDLEQEPLHCDTQQLAEPLMQPP